MSTKSSVIVSPRLLLDRLTKLVSSIAGLDASLMLVQYSSPLIIALLLRLVKFRAAHPRVRFGVEKGGIPVPGSSAGLVNFAAGLGKAAVSIGDARVIMRAFGELPMNRLVAGGLIRLQASYLSCKASLGSTLTPSVLYSASQLVYSGRRPLSALVPYPRCRLSPCSATIPLNTWPGSPAKASYR